MLTRMCAVAALRGQTWADKRVFDSDNTPLSRALVQNEEAKPYIVVYTDVDNRSENNGTDLTAMRRELALTLEIGVASKVDGKTGEAEIKIPLTDEGMEIALDMVEQQALSALFGDPQNEWAELLKSLVISVERVSGQRGASSDRDHRWAARQVSIVCDVVSDVPHGVPISEEHPIYLFTEVSKRHPEAEMDHAAEICTAMVNDKTSPQWEQVQAALGVRRLGLRAIGLAPLPSSIWPMANVGDDLTDKNGEAPILRKITHDDMDMERDESVGLVDEFSISTNVGILDKLSDKPDTVEMDGNGG